MKGCDRLALTAVGVLSFLSMPARADLLIDTVLGDTVGSPSPSAYFIHYFPPASGALGDDFRTAIAFNVAQGQAYAVDSIVLNVAARNLATQHLTVTLSRPDAGGLPGATLSAYSVTNLPVRPDGSGPITYPLMSVATPNRPVLMPGKYWISLSTPDANFQSDIYWYNRDDRSCLLAVLSSPVNGTAWSGTNANVSPAPQVRVSATPVPEPTSASLLLVGGVMLVARRRKRSS